MRSAILVVCVLLGIRMRASGRWLTLACRNKSGSRVRPLTLSRCRSIRLRARAAWRSVLLRTDLAGKPPLDLVCGAVPEACFFDCNDSLQHVGRFAGMDYQEHAMSVNKDQVKGRTHEVEGKINEVTGKVLGDKKLEVKGKVQQIGGEAQAKLGDVRQELKDTSKKGA